jgi:hypothetical protein
MHSAGAAEESSGSRTGEQDRNRATRRRLLGLIAEQVSDVVSLRQDEVIFSSMHLPQAAPSSRSIT